MNFDKALKFFLPKDKEFFPLFEKTAKNVSEASEILVILMSENDFNKQIPIIRRIKELEHKGDKLSHEIYEHLNRTFITPFDREDIHMLASNIDNVLDNINGVAMKFELYRPKTSLSGFSKMAEMIKNCAVEMEIAIDGLRNAGSNKKLILESCININTFENMADEIFHESISELFETEKDAKELIKKKSILETLEKAVDRAEDISDTIKGILVKMA